jgi:hypothetical protein
MWLRSDVDAGPAVGIGIAFAQDFSNDGWGVAAAEDEVAP